MGAHKKKNRMPPFVGLSRQMLNGREWRCGLSSSAKVLYIHLKNKYVGHNNGELCLHYSEMKDVMAPGTIWRAFKELEQKGWIVKDHRVGGEHRFNVFYKLTGQYDNAITQYRF